MLLLELGADSKARDNSDNTPLHLASKTGLVEVAEILLDRGADTNARNNDNAVPLHFASESGDLEIVRMLLDRHADVNARDKNYNTPFHSVLKGSYVSTDALDLHVDANTEKGLTHFNDFISSKECRLLSSFSNRPQIQMRWTTTTILHYISHP